MTMPPPRTPQEPPRRRPILDPPVSGLPMGGALFTDRVMARVAQEPTPSPGRVLLRSLRHLALRDALTALLTAWRLAFEPAGPASASARASAAAAFLSFAIVVGLGGSLVAGGALAIIGSDGSDSQQLAPGASPSASPVLVAEPTPSPSAAIEPTPSPEPSISPAPAITPSAAPTPVVQERQAEERKPPQTPEPRERERDAKETPEREDRERDDAEGADD